jgi:hypothetical protein
VPIRLGRGMNDRAGHWARRAARAKHEQHNTGWALRQLERPVPPLLVTITRVAPGNGLDDDNLAGACKNVRDAVAAWLGVDDKHQHLVRYRYAQQRGPWTVWVELTSMPDSANMQPASGGDDGR